MHSKALPTACNFQSFIRLKNVSTSKCYRVEVSVSVINTQTQLQCLSARKKKKERSAYNQYERNELNKPINDFSLLVIYTFCINTADLYFCLQG